MNRNIFVYPRLSAFDLNLIRFGGPGLANLMFGWANALHFAEENGFEMIWPTWPQIKLATLTGKFGDKRIYWRVFHKPRGMTGGLKKFCIRLVCKKISLREDDVRTHSWKTTLGCLSNRNVIFEFGPKWTQVTSFESLFPSREKIKAELTRMRPPQTRNPSLSYIAVHVRFGDLPFDGSEVMNGQRVRSHAKLPQNYYIDVIQEIKTSKGSDLEIRLFSDANDDELQDILKVSGVKRIRGNSALDEMLEMSEATVLIASCSTFSKWASFLGSGMVIWPPLTDCVVSKTDRTQEYEYLPGKGLFVTNNQ